MGLSTADPSAPDLSAFSLCATHGGDAPVGAVEVTCTSPVSGRYLAVRIVGSSEALVLCEVDVYQGIGELYDDVNP